WHAINRRISQSKVAPRPDPSSPDLKIARPFEARPVALAMGGPAILNLEPSAAATVIGTRNEVVEWATFRLPNGTASTTKDSAQERQPSIGSQNTAAHRKSVTTSVLVIRGSVSGPPIVAVRRCEPAAFGETNIPSSQRGAAGSERKR